jgi:DNA-binding transcriptional regulator YiaG
MTDDRALAAAATRAADDLRELADAITAVLDALPKNTSKGSRLVLEQQARRALALSASLRVEAARPDPALTAHLLRAKVLVATIVLSVLTTLTTGFLEEVGAQAVGFLKAKTEVLFDRSDRIQPQNVEQDGFGGVLRSLRLEQGLSQRDLGERFGVSASAVSRWERNENLPSSAAFSWVQQQVGPPAWQRPLNTP